MFEKIGGWEVLLSDTRFVAVYSGFENSLHISLTKKLQQFNITLENL